MTPPRRPRISRRTALQGMGAAAALSTLGLPALAGKGRKPDVLFVSIDDLNDWTGVLGGHPQADTPNIDRLARRGTVFANAHCTAPACNPSRASILLGQRPTTTGIYDNDQPFRRGLPDAVTLPAFFRKHGYLTRSAGKIFHTPDRQSFDEVWPAEGCSWEQARKRAFPKAKNRPHHGIRGMGSFDWGPGRARRPGAYSDDMVADRVSRWLGQKDDQPVFIGCGFFRPHLPWFVPQRYFDRYPLDSLEKPVVKEGDLQDVPAAGRRMARIQDHERIVAAKAWKKAVQAYLASLSFADDMLGRVLDALDRSHRADDTLIVLWSDHGWGLGEKMHWKKFALWEECTRVPLVFAGAGIKKKQRCERAVSLQDLWPTLTDLAGLPTPDRIEGESLVPLLKDPGARRQTPALTTWGRGNHAVRDDRYRYIRYADGGEELYDHMSDPREWTNLADPKLNADGRHDETIARLAAFLPLTEAAPAPRGEHECGGDD